MDPLSPLLDPRMSLMAGVLCLLLFDNSLVKKDCAESALSFSSRVSNKKVLMVSFNGVLDFVFLLVFWKLAYALLIQINAVSKAMGVRCILKSWQ